MDNLSEYSAECVCEQRYMQLLLFARYSTDVSKGLSVSPHHEWVSCLLDGHLLRPNFRSTPFGTQHVITNCVDVKVLTVYHSYIAMAYLKLQIGVA